MPPNYLTTACLNFTDIRKTVDGPVWYALLTGAEGEFFLLFLYFFFSRFTSYSKDTSPYVLENPTRIIEPGHSKIEKVNAAPSTEIPNAESDT